jgi:hypothetical protein
MRGDGLQSPKCACFYVLLVVCLQQIQCVDVIYGFPCVIALRVSSPFDKILQGVTAPEVSMIPDGFHLTLHFSTDQVRWWS